MCKFMRRIGLLLVAGFLATERASVAQVTASIVTTPPATRELSWAEKMFSQLKLEMGTVAKGAEVSQTLTIRNLYKETITISGIGTTCGCFKAVIDNKTLKTNEVATVQVSMDTLRFSGKREANLDVTTTFDNVHYKSVRSPLLGFIRTDVEIVPGRVNFGAIEQGRTAQKTVTVKLSGRPGWAIQEVKSNNALVTTQLAKRFDDGYRSEWDVTVSLADSAPLGDVRDLLTVVTNDANAAPLPVEVQGKVEPDVVVTPSLVTLGNLRPGIDKAVTVVIRAQRPFAIDKIERDSELDCWKCKVSKDVKNVHIISLTMNPPEEPGDYSETFTVTIAGRPEPVTFEARGTIVSATASAP
jgi:hypothetical protein